MKKLVFAILTTSLAGSLYGSSVFSDSFAYPDGGIVTNSTWLPNTGTANSMVVSNQQLLVTSARSEDIAHTLTGAPFDTNGAVPALYSSFTLKCVGLPTAAGTYFAHFTGADRNGTLTGHRARIFSSITNVAAGGLADSTHFFIGIGNSSSANATSGQWPTGLATNVTYTVVTKYVIGTATATIWIDPSSEADPSVTATDFVDPTNYVNIGHYGFRQASGEGSMIIDDLKVGTAFSDVAGANTSPTISAIEDQNIPANGTTGPLDFIVGDAETPAGSLTVTASSDNTALVPNANIGLGGTDANRTITVTPASGVQGIATITVNVSDGVNTSPTSFQVKVGAPTIGAIGDVMAYTNEAVPAISFTVNDPENDTLTLTAASSNPTLLPSANIAFSGSGNNRTATLSPISGVNGLTTITISVSDGHNTNSTSFDLTMSPRLGLLFADDFPYTSNPFSDPNGVALYQADGSTWQHASGTAYEITVTNGLVYMVGTNTEDVGHDLISTNTPSSAVLVYASFKTTFSFLPSSAGDYFVHLKASGNDTSAFKAKVFADKAGAASGFFRLGIANSANTSTEFPMDLSLGTTYTVISRYNAGTGKTWLWINPSSETSPNIQAADAGSPGTIGGIALRESSGMGDMTIQNLKVGTSWSDVFTSTAPAPEPLQISISGGNAVLTWTNSAFSLYSSPTVNGTYTLVTGATSPYSTPLSGASQFFKLVYP